MNKVLTETLRVIRIGDSLPEDIVFQSVHGTSYHSFRTSLERAVRRTGIEGLTVHDLRHTFVSRLVMARVDLPTLKDFMGRKNINMTLGCTHLSSGRKQLVVDALERVDEKVPSIFPTVAVDQTVYCLQAIDFPSMPR